MLLSIHLFHRLNYSTYFGSEIKKIQYDVWINGRSCSKHSNGKFVTNHQQIEENNATKRRTSIMRWKNRWKHCERDKYATASTNKRGRFKFPMMKNIDFERKQKWKSNLKWRKQLLNLNCLLLFYFCIIFPVILNLIYFIFYKFLYFIFCVFTLKILSFWFDCSYSSVEEIHFILTFDKEPFVKCKSLHFTEKFHQFLVLFKLILFWANLRRNIEKRTEMSEPLAKLPKISGYHLN